MKYEFQEVMDLAFPPTFGDEAFYVSNSNRTLVNYIATWPWETSLGLIILGPQGSGKTHLSHIIARKTDGQPLSLPDFSLENVRENINVHPCLILDDLDKHLTPNYEVALFHLFNFLQEQKHANSRISLVITATNPLDIWKITLPDLASRLKTLNCFSLEAPDQELLGAVLLKEFSDQQLTLTPQMAHYILTHGERSCSYIQRLVQTLNHLSLREKRKVTLPLIRQTMAEMKP